MDVSTCKADFLGATGSYRNATGMTKQPFSGIFGQTYNNGSICANAILNVTGIRVNSGHGLSVGNVVHLITNNPSYNGAFSVIAVGTDYFTIDVKYVSGSTASGQWQLQDYYLADWVANYDTAAETAEMRAIAAAQEAENARIYAERQAAELAAAIAAKDARALATLQAARDAAAAKEAEAVRTAAAAAAATAAQQAAYQQAVNTQMGGTLPDDVGSNVISEGVYQAGLSAEKIREMIKGVPTIAWLGIAGIAGYFIFHKRK